MKCLSCGTEYEVPTPHCTNCGAVLEQPKEERPAVPILQWVLAGLFLLFAVLVHVLYIEGLPSSFAFSVSFVCIIAAVQLLRRCPGASVIATRAAILCPVLLFICSLLDLAPLSFLLLSIFPWLIGAFLTHPLFWPFHLCWITLLLLSCILRRQSNSGERPQPDPAAASLFAITFVLLPLQTIAYDAFSFSLQFFTLIYLNLSVICGLLFKKRSFWICLVVLVCLAVEYALAVVLTASTGAARYTVMQYTLVLIAFSYWIMGSAAGYISFGPQCVFGFLLLLLILMAFAKRDASLFYGGYLSVAVISVVIICTVTIFIVLAHRHPAPKAAPNADS